MKMEKEEFAHKIVEGYDMDTLIDAAVLGILYNWENEPTNLQEEIKQRQDILQGEQIDEFKTEE